MRKTPPSAHYSDVLRIIYGRDAKGVPPESTGLHIVEEEPREVEPHPQLPKSRSGKRKITRVECPVEPGTLKRGKVRVRRLDFEGAVGGTTGHLLCDDTEEGMNGCLELNTDDCAGGEDDQWLECGIGSPQ